ncbi:MAG: hypothetical protein GXP30_12160 [Verrucomicrobia bacterium]|nr:hypothetical protein [Verrucomicrobiota bacterium]
MPERRTMASSRQKRKVCIAVPAMTGQDGRQRLVIMENLKKTVKLASKRLALLFLVFALSSCASLNVSSRPSKKSREVKEIEAAPIYVVMSEGAPFYLNNALKGRRADKSQPFLYLPKGTLVKVLKNEVPYSDVYLTNGMKGWMPISALAPQMATSDGPASSVEPVSSGPGASATNAAVNPENGVKLPSY